VQDRVTVHMTATPEQIWVLVSDVTQIGRYSPETFEAEWIERATGPAVGARFRGHVKRNGIGPIYWTTRTVTDDQQGELLTPELPKTHSGKIMRRLLRDVAEHRELGDVTTQMDAAVVTMIDEMMATSGSSEPEG
jgi:acyl-CoA synthetase (AMP-forming)/AMP-acid ligase II